MLLKLVLLQVIVVFLIDLSGGITSIKHAIWKWLKPHHAYRDFEFKPFECSLCMMFWTGLIFLLITHNFTLPYIAIVSVLSFLTTVTKSALITIREIMNYILRKIDDTLYD